MLRTRWLFTLTTVAGVWAATSPALGDVTWLGGDFGRSITAINGSVDKSSSDQGGPGLLQFQSSDAYSDADISAAASVSGVLSGNTYTLSQNTSARHHAGDQSSATVNTDYSFTLDTPENVTISTSARFDFGSNGVLVFWQPGTGNTLFIYPTGSPSETGLYSATLGPGTYTLTAHTLTESNGTVANISATMTVTPEPSLLAWLALPALVLARRGRRK